MKLAVSGNRLLLWSTEQVNTGTVGWHEAKFKFDECWDNLTPTAVWRVMGEKSWAVLITDGKCTVPWEALKRALELSVAVIGVDTNGTTVLTTNYVSLGQITKGADISALGREPTPSALEQVLKLADHPNKIKNGTWWVWNVSTQSYEDTGASPGQDGFSPTAAVSKVGSVTTLTVTDRDGIHTEYIKDGADGKTPVKGVDYWTSEDLEQIAYGVDGETICLNERGLMAVKTVPIASVTDLTDTLEQISHQIIDASVNVATNENAGIVKASDEVSVLEDGTMFIAAIAQDKVDGLEDRLVNIEQTVVGGVCRRGSVSAYEDLPDDPRVGDLYEVVTGQSEWCWDGIQWFEYGKVINLSPVATTDLNEDQLSITDDTLHIIAVDAALVTCGEERLDTTLAKIHTALTWGEMDA